MKKLLMIVDMEGIAGIGVNEFWSTIKCHPLYYLKRHFLVEEVNSAIRGAIKGGLGTEEIVVVDWHLTNHNFRQDELPSGVTLVRGGEHKFLKVGIEKVFLIGFHGAAGTPFRYAHSFSYTIKDLVINGKSGGETTMWAYTAGSMGIPIVLLTGDIFAIKEIKSLGLETVCIDTKGAKDMASIEDTHKRIELAAEQAVTKDIKPLPTPSPFSVQFSFKSSKMTRNLPAEYFTRRDGEYFVIEGKNAYDVYDLFHAKIERTYIRSMLPGHRLLSMFERP